MEKQQKCCLQSLKIKQVGLLVVGVYFPWDSQSAKQVLYLLSYFYVRSKISEFSLLGNRELFDISLF